MENFVWDIPTKLYFGKDVCNKLREILPTFGTRVLLLRGGDSTIKNGVRAKIVQEIETANMDWKEFSGIKSNPEVEETRQAVCLGKEFNPDVILAVGGGSVIDTAKAVAAAIPVENDVWDLYTGKLKAKSAVPIVTVLTLAATGTEMNPFSVMQNKEYGLKTSFTSKHVAPKYSFLDPSFTVSVPRNYTAYGISDLVAHCLEAWFGQGDASLSDKFTISIIKEAMEFGPKLLREVDNADLRARIMYAATCALNEITMFGRKSGDWGVHGLGHVFSLLYDIPHGSTLSAVYPAWLKLIAERDAKRIIQFGNAAFNVNNVEDTIENTKKMFRSFLSPTSLTELKIENFNEKQVVDYMIKANVSGHNYTLETTDYQKILDFMKE